MKILWLIGIWLLAVFPAFAANDGMVTLDGFEFGGHGYGGIRSNGYNFFVYVPIWDGDTQLPALQLGMPDVPVKTVAESPYSRLSQGVYKLVRPNAAGDGWDSTDFRLHIRFRQWRGMPLVAVDYRVENCSDQEYSAMLMLIGNGIPADATVTSERWSPPPARIVTEPLEVKFQMSSSAFFLLSAEGRNMGLIGRQCRNYTGNTLELYYEKSPLPARGFSENYAISFVSGVAEYEALEQYGQALEILGKRFFAAQPGAGFVAGSGMAIEDTRVTVKESAEQVVVGMEALDTAPEKRQIRFRANGDPVWQDDCLELSIASDVGAGHYWHLMVNPLGTRSTFHQGNTDCDGAGLWTATAADDAAGWRVEFTVSRRLFDPAMLQREGAARVHFNREAPGHQELSGWPDGRFHQPDSFGTLLFVDYPEYLRRQLGICRQLTDQPIEVAIPSDDLAALALADHQLTLLRRRLEFAADLRRGMELVESGSGAEELLRILERCQPAAEELGEVEAFNRLRAASLLKSSGGKSFRIWNKSPWSYLDPNEFPAEAATPVSEVELDAGIGEYESASVAVTNFSPAPLHFQVEVTDNPGAVGVELHYGYPVTGVMGKRVNDPLPRLVDGMMTLPPGESRELWLTLHTAGVVPGTYPVTVTLTPDDGTAAETVTVRLRVHPVEWRLPEDFIAPFFTLYSGVLAEDPAYVAAFRRNLEEHSIRCQTPTLFPEPRFDSEGNNRSDYAGHFESMQRNFYVRNGDTVLIFWGVSPEDLTARLERGLGAESGSEEYKRRFKIWLDEWVEALRTQGMEQDFYMYVFDERTDPEAVAFYRLIKELCPAVKTYATVTSTATLEDIRALGPYLDMIGPHFQSFRHNTALWEYLRGLDIPVAPYFNCVPCGTRLEPYEVYRKMGWHSFAAGARGFGTWLYFQPFFHAWEPPNMSMVYVRSDRIENALAGAPEVLAPDDLVVTSKRLEGFREGVEDYGWLRLLEEELRRCGGSAEGSALLDQAVKGVVEEASPATAARWKREILNMIEKLRK